MNRINRLEIEEALFETIELASQPDFFFMEPQRSENHFWDTRAGLVLKVLVLSTVISVAIKYLGPTLPIAATNTSALTISLLPALIMGLVLAWRSWQQRQ